MKAENWFQLRIVGVTTIREPGFGRAFSVGTRMPRPKAQDGGELACDESPVSDGPTDAHSLGQSWKDHEVG
jgi:hypothetical protein